MLFPSLSNGQARDIMTFHLLSSVFIKITASKMDPAIENDTNRPIQQVRRLVQSSIRRVEGISNDPITDSDLLVRAYGQVVEIMSTTSRELQCQLQILKDQKLRMDQAEKTASSQIQANLTAHIAKLAEIEHQKEEELRKSQEKSISNEELSQKVCLIRACVGKPV